MREHIRYRLQVAFQSDPRHLGLKAVCESKYRSVNKLYNYRPCYSINDVRTAYSSSFEQATETVFSKTALVPLLRIVL